jgi:hypothetical protein
VSQSRVAVAVDEAQGQLGNAEEKERPPLEAVTRRLVKTMTEKAVCVRERETVICKVQSRVVSNSIINPIINSNSIHKDCCHLTTLSRTSD